MRLEVWAESDKGLKRDNNQDSFLVDEGLGLFVVADGMGGHKGGEVASAIAVQTVQELVKQEPKPLSSPRDMLKKIYREAGHRIFDKAQYDSPELHGMGTTMVVAIWSENSLFIGNVGDSRAYLIVGTNMWQITEDHSLINEQIRAGILTPENAKNVSGKNVITRSVGFEREVLCDIFQRQLVPGEMVLMCSDGLSGLVEDQRILEIVNNTPIDDVVSQLISEAKANGGDDNITALLIQVKV